MAEIKDSLVQRARLIRKRSMHVASVSQTVQTFAIMVASSSACLVYMIEMRSALPVNKSIPHIVIDLERNTESEISNGYFA